MIVIKGTVVGGTIIPDGNRPLAPVESTGEFVLSGVAIQVIQ